MRGHAGCLKSQIEAAGHGTCLVSAPQHHCGWPSSIYPLTPNVSCSVLSYVVSLQRGRWLAGRGAGVRALCSGSGQKGPGVASASQETFMVIVTEFGETE